MAENDKVGAEFIVYISCLNKMGQNFFFLVRDSNKNVAGGHVRPTND